MEHDTGSGEPAPGLAGAADRPAGARSAEAGASARPAEARGAEGGGAVPEPSEPWAQTAVPATGEPRVDGALRRLGQLDGLPVSEHPPVFERIHGELVEVLGELHSGPDSASRGGQAG